MLLDMNGLMWVTIFWLLGANAEAKPLWESWYIVYADGVTPSSYYTEKVYIQGSELRVQLNQYNKSPEGIEEEHLGCAAKNNSDLTPLKVTYQKTSPTENRTVDGALDATGRVFHSSVAIGKEPRRTLKAAMQPKLFFVSMFPAWLGKNAKRITSVQQTAFTVLQEDRIDTQFPIADGSVMETQADLIAKNTGSRKLRVKFSGDLQYWWVMPSGEMIRMENAQSRAVIEKTTKEKALAAFSPAKAGK
jgi:hypothetical protein